MTKVEAWAHDSKDRLLDMAGGPPPHGDCGEPSKECRNEMCTGVIDLLLPGEGLLSGTLESLSQLTGLIREPGHSGVTKAEAWAHDSRDRLLDMAGGPPPHGDSGEPSKECRNEVCTGVIDLLLPGEGLLSGMSDVSDLLRFFFC